MSSEGENTPAKAPERGSWVKQHLFFALSCAVVFVIVVLGLALGLGLGLGLKHNHAHSSLDTSSPAAPSATASPDLEKESWRLPAAEYTLDMASWNYTAPRTTRTYNFTLSEIDAYPDGVLRQILVINGVYPAPTIRLNRGDRLLINVTNNMSDSTTLHWHGLYQNGSIWMDGTGGITQCPIPPGRSFLYNFTVENQFGTFWYHSHVGTQRVDGLFGALIVHAPEELEYQKRYGYTRDQIIILQDYYHNFSTPLLAQYLAPDNENNEPVPDNGLIQGSNYFNCSLYGEGSGYTCYDNSSYAVVPAAQNQKTRFRLINAGAFADFQVGIDNHTMTIVEADATMVEPLDASTLKIATAQRYSFIINANQTATNYWIRAEMNTNCFAYSNPFLDITTRAILSYTNNSDLPGSNSVGWQNVFDPLCEDLNATLLTPSVAQVAPPADEFYVIQFAFQIGAYALDLAYINGTSWTPALLQPTINHVISNLSAGNPLYNQSGVAPNYGVPSQFILNIPEYKVIDILVQNFDDGSHPFHLHGYDFWVMASSQEQYFPYGTGYYQSLNTTNPMRRDTVMIDSYGWTLIRVRADNPGVWAFHCHIAWHLSAGLLMQLQTRDDLMKGFTIPRDVLGLCDV